MNILIEKVLPNPEQPRKAFDPDELKGLAQSIRENGVINAITVEEAPGGAYILHDGERRLRAAKMAGLTEIPAMVVPALNGGGSRKRLVRSLVANVQRSDLNPIEEARAYREMCQVYGMSRVEVADRCGIFATRVSIRLNLLRLDDPIQELIASGQLSHSPEATDAIMSISDSRQRIALAQKAAERKLTIKAIQAACARLKEYLENDQAFDAGHVPALAAAYKRTGRPKKSRPRWDMLAQVGSLPPWSMVILSAAEVCERCTLRPMASKATCQECPGVELLIGMLRRAAP